MEAFVHNAQAVRVLFGRGSRARVGEEIDRLGRSRAAIIATHSREHVAQEIADSIGVRTAIVLLDAVMHTPVDVTETALREVQRIGADCSVAVGGGSTIGLAKALALRADLPQIALPSTYSGSEMTNVVGQTANGRKTTVKDDRVLPRTVIYDVDYCVGLPVRVAVTSGLNAFAHAVEALYARECNPLVRMQCLEAIRALADALPGIADRPDDVEAREVALYGAFLCGLALSVAGMALHHKLCHVLGGSFGTPHAETHSIILPHATQFNADFCDGALDEVANILNADTPGGGIWDLAGRIGAPRSLREVGFDHDDVDRAADIAMANPYWNPHEFTRDDIQQLLHNAVEGQRPV